MYSYRYRHSHILILTITSSGIARSSFLRHAGTRPYAPLKLREQYTDMRMLIRLKPYQNRRLQSPVEPWFTAAARRGS